MDKPSKSNRESKDSVDFKQSVLYDTQASYCVCNAHVYYYPKHAQAYTYLTHLRTFIKSALYMYTLLYQSCVKRATVHSFECFTKPERV